MTPSWYKVNNMAVDDHDIKTKLQGGGGGGALTNMV